jgi:hypothetical protein
MNHVDVALYGLEQQEVLELECPICLENITAATVCQLPCMHRFHSNCIHHLREVKRCEAKANRSRGSILEPRPLCPMCRAKMPRSPADLNADAVARYSKFKDRVRIGLTTWESLTPFEQATMNNIVAIWMSAANQGSDSAQHVLGYLYDKGYGVTQSDAKAAQWYWKAALRGNSKAQVKNII